MEKSLLTAIIFTYNHKSSIARCIESLVNQKTEYPYEIRIYDDCSTDGTSDICIEYAKKYPDKIKLTVQPENTFLKPDLELQSYSAIKAVDTKYFCVVDGDDYWCDENKIQMALDFLENNPEYIGWAHDTYQENELTGEKNSYIHEICKINEIKNPVNLDSKAPFFLTSSRIFRNFNYAELRILPIDYLVYYYHLSKGPIYYEDKIMAAYTIGACNTFANLKTKEIVDLNSMFSYRLSKLFDFKEDNFCTKIQLKYDESNGIGKKRYDKLCLLKKIFGIKLGWHIWFFITFVLKYGIEVTNINYVYDRKKAKRNSSPEYRIKKCSKEIEILDKKINREEKKIKFLVSLLKYEKSMPKFIFKRIQSSIKRKQTRIEKFNNKNKNYTRIIKSLEI